MKLVRMLTLTTLIMLIANTALVFAAVTLEPYASVTKPSELVWTGRTLLVAAEDEGMIKLFSINPNTKAVERFAPTFAGSGEVHFASSSGAYFPKEYVYASSGDTIQEITAKGDTVRVFVTPSKGVNIAGLVFDNRGYWNYKLIAVTYDGAVWEIDKSGEVKRLADVGEGVVSGGVAVARDEYGEFSGNILVTSKDKNRLVAVDNRDQRIRTVAELPATPGRIVYIPANSDLYLSKHDEGRIVKMDREVVQDHLAQIMVLTREADKSVSLVAVKSARAGVNVTKITSITAPDIDGAAFILDTELADALKGVIDEETEDFNPLLIILPIMALVLVGTFVVLWRYRGF